jgi:hypothetical protein
VPGQSGIPGQSPRAIQPRLLHRHRALRPDADRGPGATTASRQAP